jgi:hypothetical protein
MLAIMAPQAHRLADLAACARVVVRKSGMPSGAAPVIWAGPSPRPTVHETDMHSFSLDELALLKQLVDRITKRLQPNPPPPVGSK